MSKIQIIEAFLAVASAEREVLDMGT